MLFVSVTVPVTVGDPVAVTVNVHVFDPKLVFPVNVSHVNVQVPVFALGIFA